MKRLLVLYFFLGFFSWSPVFSQVGENTQFAKYGIYDTDIIKPDEYHQRRAAVIAKMDSGSVAIFRANDPSKRVGDTDYKYRQNSNLLYLTGCNEPNSTLILVRDGIRVDSASGVKEILFVRSREKTWKGENLDVEGAREILGFGDTSTSIVLTNERLWDLLPGILQASRILYYTPSLPDIIFDPVSDRKFVTLREVNKGLEEKYPGLTIKNVTSLINDLRAVKSLAELALMQKAIDATVEGCIDAMKKCEPGMYEYQIQAIIEYCFTKNGCEYYGYPSIVGSGPNSFILHYGANRRQMNSGELVVMDVGAEYHGYSVDVARTIPVNGKFSTAQKEIYELVLRAQELVLTDIRPGAMINVSGKMAMDFISEGLLKLGIIKDKSEASKYCPHSISHFIGLEVHDVGWMGMLEPGMVFTIEPGIYIPDSSQCDKKYWGIAVRIEDDVLITEDGYNILSDGVPTAVADIEKLMRKRQKSNVKSNSVKNK
jgi:Xaa-Pro aminopeptidase